MISSIKPSLYPVSFPIRRKCPFCLEATAFCTSNHTLTTCCSALELFALPWAPFSGPHLCPPESLGAPFLFSLPSPHASCLPEFLPPQPPYPHPRLIPRGGSALGCARVAAYAKRSERSTLETAASRPQEDTPSFPTYSTASLDLCGSQPGQALVPRCLAKQSRGGEAILTTWSCLQSAFE